MSNFLITSLSPWIVSVALLTCFLIILIQLPQLIRFTLKLSLPVRIILMIVVIGGIFVRFGWVPNQHRIYFDEDRYLSGAVTFAKFNKSTLIDVATPQKLIMGDPDLVARSTVPTINGWVIKLFEDQEIYLFYAAKIMSVIQIILIFVAAYLFFKSLFIATFGAVIFAFLPVNVFWSVSIGLDAYFVFFALLAFVAAFWYAKEPNVKSALFLTASTLLLLFVRLESFLFLIVLFTTIFALRKIQHT